MKKRLRKKLNKKCVARMAKAMHSLFERDPRYDLLASDLVSHTPNDLVSRRDMRISIY